MQAILYVGHGTRVKQGVAEAIKFIEETKQQVNVDIQETAFLEIVKPDIVQGVTSCVERGASKIAIVPILLLTAQHANQDIPEEIAKAKAIFPHVEFTIGQPFGIHERLIDTIYERIVEQNVNILPEAEVLLVGRGSSDLTVVRDMTKISKQLQQKYSFTSVSSCFLYGAGPSFEKTLDEFKKRDVKQVFIVPYLLFSGLLSLGIKKKVEQSAFDESRIILCGSLGYNNHVRQVLIERAYEAI